jgi:hypothetical protein
VVEGVLGSADIPEVAMTSATAPGITHRWTNMWAYADEVALARIYAGFHYRFSTRVGQDMGRQIGRLVTQKLMVKRISPRADAWGTIRCRRPRTRPAPASAQS